MRSAIHPAEAVGLHCLFSTIDCRHTCVCVCVHSQSIVLPQVAPFLHDQIQIPGSRLGDHCTHQEFVIKFCCQVGKVRRGGGVGSKSERFFFSYFKKVQS